MTIHDDNPFVDPESDRDPARRFRGRLIAPVTIVTAGAGDDVTGLTVSSLFVVEGEPARVQLVVGPLTDLWAAIGVTGRFVVHVCDAENQAIADVFAGLRPNPGGIFAGHDYTDSEWGPVLQQLPDRAFCTVESMDEVGYSGVMVAEIVKVELSDLEDPLAYFRGRYRGLV